jgi:hypothetical protein
VGIAIGTGSAVAMASSAITLVQGDVGAVADAIDLSRATLRVIRQNLAWAIGYNAVLIPLAMLHVVPPVLAALAMACSSVTVVGNALRLRHFGAGWGGHSTLASRARDRATLQAVANALERAYGRRVALEWSRRGRARAEDGRRVRRISFEMNGTVFHAAWRSGRLRCRLRQEAHGEVLHEQEIELSEWLQAIVAGLTDEARRSHSATLALSAIVRREGAPARSGKVGGPVHADHHTRGRRHLVRPLQAEHRDGPLRSSRGDQGERRGAVEAGARRV